MSPRTKPYTERGLRRLKCVRCDRKASSQFKICSDGSIWRPLCLFCDIELNRVALKFMRFPKWEEMAAEYESEKLLEMIEEEGPK